jgi:hypothetical protein
MFSPYYHGILRKYVVLFGTIFNDIYINRDSAQREAEQTMKVPLSYGPKEKFLSRLEGDPNLNRPIAMVLPRMAFEITAISYAADRKLNTVNRISKQDTNAAKTLYQYEPVPYDIGFTLYIMVKNADDGTRIIEQILPYFTPSWNLSAKLIPELDVVKDIPIILNQVFLQDTYEGDYINRRAIVWTLTFTLKGYLFGPTRSSNGIIKTAITNFYVPSTNTAAQGVGITDVSEIVTVKPGLTINGDPTSNADLSISTSEIKATDDYGFIIDFESSFNE